MLVSTAAAVAAAGLTSEDLNSGWRRVSAVCAQGFANLRLCLLAAAAVGGTAVQAFEKLLEIEDILERL